MKKFFAAFAVLVGLVGQTALATSLHPDTFKVRYQLKEFDVNAETVLLRSILNLPEGKRLSGHVVLDHAASTVTLTIQRPFHCPPGRVCAMVMPRPIVLEFKLTQSISPFCGGMMYFAEMVTEDGMRSELSIYDERGNFCERGRPQPYNVKIGLSEILDDSANEPLVVYSTFQGQAIER